MALPGQQLLWLFHVTAVGQLRQVQCGRKGETKVREKFGSSGSPSCWGSGV